jgi:DNA-binding MarR family transcriptional regulator
MTPPRPTASADREVERRIGVAWRELRRGASMAGLRAFLFGEGPDALDLGQIDTLDLLAQAESWRMRDLAAALRVDASTATRAVDRLVSAGLAERTRPSADARAVAVALTPLGRDRHDTVMARRRIAMDRILEGFATEERAVLADLLERLVAGLDALAAAEAERGCGDPRH